MILTKTIEHKKDSFKGKWDNSGATEHILASTDTLVGSTHS